MSFQNFRLATGPSQGPPPTPSSAHDGVAPGALLHSIPLTVHPSSHHPPNPQELPDPQQQRHAQAQLPSPSKDRASRSAAAAAAAAAAAKAPYGSGDAEDGYTLVFRNMDEFERWREKEEMEKMVEFVKGDTHGSKAVPPRFKDHTKLVCARHQRSGRKKYVKKYPDRQRKVPSRKLEGVGCPASISYKTYFDTEEVRVMYHEQHSHSIGEANLPFTRRGRRIEVAKQKFKVPEPEVSQAFEVPRPNAMTSDPQAASTSHSQMTPSQHPAMLGAMGMQPHSNMASSMAMHGMGAMGGANVGAPAATDVAHDRWDRLEVLFQSIRGHARNGYEYPTPSVAALESVLIRLYLESPVARGGGGGGFGGS